MSGDDHLSLECFASRQLGWHTGKGQFVVKSEMERLGVLHHESIHGRLFERTFDGHLHLLSILASKQLPEAESLAYYLFDSTREAHERTATYLGIAALSTQEEREVEYARLPTDYRRYYDYFDSFIDRRWNSFIRFAVAWGISHWAFSSSRIMLLANSEIPTVAEMGAIDGPTERLTQFRDRLRSLDKPSWMHKLVQGAAQSASDQGYTWTDIESEEEWLENSGVTTKVQATDVALVECTRRWIVEELGLPVAPSEGIDVSTVAREWGIKGLGIVSAEFVIPGDDIRNLSDDQLTLLLHKVDSSVVKNSRSAAVVHSASEWPSSICDDHGKEFYLTGVVLPGEMQSQVLINLHLRTDDGFLERRSFIFDWDGLGGVLRCANSAGCPGHKLALVQELNADCFEKFFAIAAAAGVPVYRVNDLESFSKMPAPAILPFIYIARSWSKSLLSFSGGSLVEVSVSLVHPLHGGQEEFYVQVRFPEDQSLVPMVKITNGPDAGVYSFLASRRVASGHLERQSVTSWCLEFQMLVDTIWDQLEEL